LLLLPNFNETLIFSTNFRKILGYQISRKSVQWEPNCSIRTDKQISRCDKVNSCFSQFLRTNLKT